MEVNYTEEASQEPINQEQISQRPADIKTGSNQVVYAGFLLRFVAVLIDGIILGFCLFLLGMILGLFVASGTNIIFFGLFGQLLSSLLCWLYYALMESSDKQGTIGKMVLGIKVTDLNGQKISFLRASVRYFSKIISVIILFIGHLMIIFTEKKQALHDIIAGCLVVRT